MRFDGLAPLTILDPRNSPPSPVLESLLATTRHFLGLLPFDGSPAYRQLSLLHGFILQTAFSPWNTTTEDQQNSRASRAGVEIYRDVYDNLIEALLSIYKLESKTYPILVLDSLYMIYSKLYLSKMSDQVVTDSSSRLEKAEDYPKWVTNTIGLLRRNNCDEAIPEMGPINQASVKQELSEMGFADAGISPDSLIKAVTEQRNKRLERATRDAGSWRRCKRHR